MARGFKLIFGLLIFVGWIYFANSSHRIGDIPLPPVGKLLDPFQGYLQNGDNGNPDFSGEFTLEGLNAPVQVFYDSNMVPHIYAESDGDLSMVQGYITASLRLWQMDLQSRSASGRISEVMGIGALNLDRETRRKGLVFGAEKIRNEMGEKYPDIWSNLENYAQGVNAYINSLSYSEYPIEFKLLDYSPEEWDPFNTVLLIQYMNDLLGGWDRDIENTNFAALFGKETFDSLFFPSFLDPIIPKETWEFEALTLANDTIEIDSIFNIREYRRSNPDNGSNNWAVSGNKTRSGFPILANDTHLRLWLPSLWNIQHLHSPNTNTAGFVFSGAPGIVIGFNDSIAWAFTNAPRDQRDWYDIQFRNGKDEYYHDGEWKETKMRIEEIAVKGEDPFVDTVYYTHHGPVVFDDSFPGNGSRANLAFRWIGHDPSRIITALRRMVKVSNYEEFKSALENWDSPAQNAVFASTNGDIAMRVEGTFPLKWEGQGVFVMDGSNPQHDWQGFIPHEHNAFQLNPERNFVSSANQYPVTESYPYFVYNASHETYRNRIINRILTDMDSAGVEDIMEMQQNVYNIKAEEGVSLLLDSLDRESLNDEETAMIDELENWNFEYAPELTQPVLFDYWWRFFRRDLWDELDIEEYPISWPSQASTIKLLREEAIDQWLDNQRTPNREGFSDLVTINFKRAVSRIQEREDEIGSRLKWREVNNVRLMHMSTQIEPFNSERLDIGGSGDVIMAANGTHGPSQRMVVEMTTPPKAFVSLPGGLSGAPGSSLYMNFLPYYENGEYIQLKLSITESEALHVQIFTPDE